MIVFCILFYKLANNCNKSYEIVFHMEDSEPKRVNSIRYNLLEVYRLLSDYLEKIGCLN